MLKNLLKVILFVAVAANLYASDKILAKVNGTTINESEVNAIITEMFMRNGMDPSKINYDDQRIKSVKEEIVNNLVERELLYSNAIKSVPKDIDKSVDEKFKALRDRFKSDQEFKDALKNKKTNEKEVKEKIKKNLILESYVQKISEDVKVTDAEKKDVFSKNQQAFTEPESVKASHILIKIDDKTTDKDAKSKIDSIYKELKGGKDFAELAKKYSQDGSAASGGDLGFFSKGRMVKEFEDTAFLTKVGDYSKPFKTQFGYHILKVTEKKPAKKFTYQEVEKNIEQKLKMDKVKDLVSKKVAETKIKAKVEIFK